MALYRVSREDRFDLAFKQVEVAFDKAHHHLPLDRRAPNYIRWMQYMHQVGEILGKRLGMRINTTLDEDKFLEVLEEISRVAAEVSKGKDGCFPTDTLPLPEDKRWFPALRDLLSAVTDKRKPELFIWAGPSASADIDKQRLLAARNAIATAARTHGIDKAVYQAFWNRCLSVINKNEEHWTPEHHEAVLEGLERTPGYIEAYAAQHGKPADSLAEAFDQRLATAKEQIFAVAARNARARTALKDFCRRTLRIIETRRGTWTASHREEVLNALEGMPVWIREEGVAAVANGLASQPSQTEHSLAALAAWHRRLGHRQSVIYGISREAFARGF
ncbi:hypothetical protein JCM10207_002115 [Rhodosporidiobolus poonsookiae]